MLVEYVGDHGPVSMTPKPIALLSKAPRSIQQCLALAHFRRTLLVAYFCRSPSTPFALPRIAETLVCSVCYALPWLLVVIVRLALRELGLVTPTPVE